MHEYAIHMHTNLLPRANVNDSPGGSHLHESLRNEPRLAKMAPIHWACQSLLCY